MKLLDPLKKELLMGHVVFSIMHVLAFLFGFVFLFITIPMHLIYCALADGLK